MRQRTIQAEALSLHEGLCSPPLCLWAFSVAFETDMPRTLDKPDTPAPSTFQNGSEAVLSVYPPTGEHKESAWKDLAQELPPGVPHDVNPEQYRSVAHLLEESFRKHAKARSRSAWTGG